ncbi:MAG: THUMP domain-containing protein [Candidatus Helarchaeota archaeon]
MPSNELPSHEITAILNSTKISYTINKLYDQVLLITSERNISKAIARRAAYLHRCGELLFDLPFATLEKIKNKLKELKMEEIIENKSSFAVRIKRIKNYFPKISEEKMERFLGKLIRQLMPRPLKVHLTHPEVLFFGIFTENNFIFGIHHQKARRDLIKNRAPHTKPFFHPCGLDPFLARAMVNLSEARKGDILCDPFCGSGSILTEAALMNIKPIGSDINSRMVKGCKLNLRAQGISDLIILRADATKLALTQKFILVTDPPYGRASALYGKNLQNLLSNFFENNVDKIKYENFCIIALPSSFKSEEFFSQYNFKIQYKFNYYVHRSLTRNIIAIKRI